MYTPLYLLALLPLILATPTGTNSPNAPDFMAGSNQSFFAWTSAGCGQKNTIDTSNLYYSNLLYGKNNHALVVSFALGRNMTADEQLDMSFFKGAEGGLGANGLDQECALFQYTASPYQGGNGGTKEGGLLQANICYEPRMPVTCFNLFRVKA